jgi:Holliday junction resolvasome RuvABC DNA-binding subunit
MISLTILVFDAFFVLSAVGFAACSVLSSVPSKCAVVRARVPVASAGFLVEALVRMGFKRLQAERAAAETREHCSEPLDVQVREALRVLT